MNAPTVTVADIQGKIKVSEYTVLSDGRTTICQLMLENGFTVIGTSACVSSKNYNQALGEKYAFEDAVNKIWELEGYLLAEDLHREARGDKNTLAQEQATASRKLIIEMFDVLEISLDHPNPIAHLKHRLAEDVGPALTGHPLDKIARLCHEVNRAYCEALGDGSQVPWEDAPEWQRVSARMGVDLHLMGDFGPEASHIGWMNQKLADGWQYGPVKDVTKKEHPCMVQFHMLPKEQQAKDYLFRAVVHSFKDVP